MASPSLIAAIQAALQSQLVGGGLILMVSGALMAMARSVPNRVYHFLRRQCIVSLDVLERETTFYWMKKWLDQHPYGQRARTISVGTIHQDDDPQAIFTPAPGNHWFFHKGRLFWMNRTREKVHGASHGISETFTIYTLGRSTAPLRALVAEAKAASEEGENKVSIFVSHRDYWIKMSSSVPRPLNSVVLPDGMAQTLEADIRQFLGAREWYVTRGIPWRRGYLFYGPPGTGKTSLVAALSGAIGFDIYVLNLTSGGLSDEGLIELLMNVPKGSAVLLEDVDAVVAGRDVKQTDGIGGSSVTFSGLLNALDGVASRPGIITFMTTNHREHLDPALIRPGRVDVQVEFKPATKEQLSRLFLNFYGDGVLLGPAVQFAEHFLGASMAEAQQHLLNHRHDPAAAAAARYAA